MNGSELSSPPPLNKPLECSLGCKEKIKVSMILINHQSIKTYREVDVCLHRFLTLSLDEVSDKMLAQTTLLLLKLTTVPNG